MLDATYQKFLGKMGVMTLLGAPAWLQSLAVLAVFSPTIPYFSNIWVEQGVFDVMARMVPRLVYA